MPLHYAIRYGSWRGRPRASLHLPPGGRGVLDTVASVWDGSAETFDAAFDMSEYDPIADLHLGELRFTFAPCLHYTTCYSIRIAGPEKTIVYSADTAPTDRLARFARDADLFCARPRCWTHPPIPRDAAAWTRGKRRPRPPGRGSASCCSRTYPEENDHEAVAELARSIYNGPVQVAHPGLRYDLE